ncbi:MAG TPA: hypothetical protein VMJ93_00215 [Verrucomicrobiae bacterium]|nr:hypothetical protein [Verrucomicrobiae bacterium]
METADDNLEGVGRKRNPRKTLILAGVAVAVAVVLLAIYFYHPMKIAPGSTVVVGDFENTTNDPVFNGGLRELLAAELGQTPFLHAASDEKTGEALRELGQEPDAVLTPSLARQVCNKIGAADEVKSTIELTADGYAMLFEVVDCKTGATILAEGMTSPDKEHVIDAVARAAAELRKRLGEPRKSLEKHEASAEALMSKSLVALQDYAQGRRAEAFAGDETLAAQQYKKALALDANFALAREALERVQAKSAEAK